PSVQQQGRESGRADRGRRDDPRRQSLRDRLGAWHQAHRPRWVGRRLTSHRALVSRPPPGDKMTPLEIRALLSVYARPADRLPHLAVESLTNYELIRPVAGLEPPAIVAAPRADDYVLTSRGKAMVNALMSLPLP